MTTEMQPQLLELIGAGELKCFSTMEPWHKEMQTKINCNTMREKKNIKVSIA